MAMVVVAARYGRIMLGGAAPLRLGGITERQRGTITDRNGTLLALDAERDSLVVWTPSVREPALVAELLGDILSRSAADIASEIRSARGDLVLAEGLLPEQAAAVEEAALEGLLPGVRIVRDQERRYPQAHLASHVLGFVGRDGYGLEGIEFSLDAVLAPQPREDDRFLGNDIQLTIDAAIQAHVDAVAEAAFRTHQADSVFAIVMEARTGRVLAWVAKPDYNPNTFTESTADERRNRPIVDTYEPGSVFKIFSMAALLQLGGVTPESRFVTDGGFVVPEHGIRITDLGNYGTVTPEGIIKFSSNVGAAMASQTVGPSSFHTMLGRLGFGQPTDIPLSGESPGIFRDYRTWSARSQPTIAMGQEIGVTALQMVTAATALANDGVLLQPRLVEEIRSPDGQPLDDFTRQIQARVFDPAVTREILSFMESATDNDGTARRARIDGVRVAAKTGTAEIIDPETGRYSTTAFLASCLAIYPADDPEIISYVVINNPRGEEFFGGRIAAPMIAEIGEFVVPFLGLDSAERRELDAAPVITVQRPALPELDRVWPDFRGLPSRTLLPLFEIEEISVDIRGSGRVVRQSPEPGEPIRRGDRLILELE